MVDNIKEALTRTSKIDVVLEDSEAIKEESDKFGQTATSVRKKAQCELYKQYAMIGGVVLCVLVILIIIICVSAKC